MAIPLTLSRKYTRLSNGVYKNLRPEFFGTKPSGKPAYRREFDIELTPAEIEQYGTETTTTITKFLKKYDYEITNYVDGYAKQKDAPATQKLRIGKILQNMEENTLLADFKGDPIRNIKNLKIVVSRHPHDIVSMSTGRGWSSCMASGSSNFMYVKADIHGGTMIAYLTKKSDKNLSDPLCRLLFRKYENDEGFAYYSPAKNTYGIRNEFFRPMCNKIAEQLNKKAPEGIYEYPNNFFYDDGEDRQIDTRSEETKIRIANKLKEAKRLKRIADYKEFNACYNKLAEYVENPAAFSNFSGFVYELGFSSNSLELNADIEKFFEMRSKAFQGGCPSEYIFSIYNSIYSDKFSESKKTKDDIFLEFISGMEIHLPQTYIDAVSLIKDNENVIKTLKVISSKYCYNIFDSNPNDIGGGPESFDFDPVAETIGNFIIKMKSNILTRMVDDKIITNHLSYLCNNMKQRNKTLESAFMTGISTRRTRNDLMYVYVNNNRAIINSLQDALNTSQIPEEIKFINTLAYNGSSHTIRGNEDNSFKYDEKTKSFTMTESEKKVLRECGYTV